MCKLPCRCVWFFLDVKKQALNGFVLKKIQTTATVRKSTPFFHLAVETPLSSGLPAAALNAPGDGVCSSSHCYSITEVTDTNTKPQSFEQPD